MKINQDRDFIVIVGSEIHTEVGDIIGLCLSEEIKSKNSIEIFEEIKTQGGFVVLPHPFRGHKLNQYIIEHSDAIEVFNGRSTAEENFKALELAKKYNKPFTAGSDAHFAAEIGSTYIKHNVSSLEDIKNKPIINIKEVYGQVSPRCFMDASQAIKALKSGRYLKSSQQMAYFLYHIIKYIYMYD